MKTILTWKTWLKFKDKYLCLPRTSPVVLKHEENNEYTSSPAVAYQPGLELAVASCLAHGQHQAPYGVYTEVAYGL